MLYFIIDFMLLAFIYSFIFYRKWKELSLQKLFLHTLMYIYIVMVIYVTLMPYMIPMLKAGPNNLFLDTVNFIPFRDLKAGYVGAKKEVILNIIMMMPFGFLYPMIKESGIIRIILLAFLFSLAIESLQLLSTWSGSLYARSFDVTDLITNTFGGLIGYLLFVLCHPFVFNILKKVTIF